MPTWRQLGELPAMWRQRCVLYPQRSIRMQCPSFGASNALCEPWEAPVPAARRLHNLTCLPACLPTCLCHLPPCRTCLTTRCPSPAAPGGRARRPRSSSHPASCRPSSSWAWTMQGPTEAWSTSLTSPALGQVRGPAGRVPTACCAAARLHRQAQASGLLLPPEPLPAQLA